MKDDERERRAKVLIRKALRAGVGNSFRFEANKATVLAVDTDTVTLRMPTGKVRQFSRKVGGVRL